MCNYPGKQLYSNREKYEISTDNAHLPTPELKRKFKKTKWKLVHCINPLFYSATLNHPFATMFGIKHIHSSQLAQLCRKKLLSVTEAHNNKFNHG